MNEYNYNFEITKNLKMLESALDDIEIRRYEDMTEKMTDRIKVNFVYGPKTRVLQDIKGRPDTVKFPIIGMTMTGMNRDDARNKNKIQDIIYQKPGGGYTNIRAIPFNINVQLNILAKFQQDIDQIIQNFVIFMNPYLVYSIKEPKTGNKLNVEVHWDGQVAIDYPTVGGDLANNLPYRLTATLNMVIKTWLFRTAQEQVKPICFIYDDIVITDILSCDYDKLKETTSNNVTESYSISGIPQLRYVNNYYFKNTDSPIINVEGGGFERVTSLFVSGSDTLMYPMSAYTAPDGTVFNGYPISQYSILSPQKISFKLPTSNTIGFTDIIAVTDCGWSKLTKDANRCNRVENPYPVTEPEHYNWCVQQYPYLNGLIITNNLNDMGVIDTNEDIIYYEENTIDRDAIIDKIKDLMQLGNVSVDDLV